MALVAMRFTNGMTFCSKKSEPAADPVVVGKHSAIASKQQAPCNNCFIACIEMMFIVSYFDDFLLASNSAMAFFSSSAAGPVAMRAILAATKLCRFTISAGGIVVIFASG